MKGKSDAAGSIDDDGLESATRFLAVVERCCGVPVDERGKVHCATWAGMLE